MIERYTRPEMAHIWSEENRYHQWLEVELAASEALAQTNEVPPEAARMLRKHASFTVKRIQEIEREVKHDVIAFTTAVSESMAAAGEAGASRWLHYGLTSNDVVDTAQALMVRQASDLILSGHHRARGRAEGAGVRIQGHRADRANARHPCRTHHVRPEAGAVVRRSATQSLAVFGRRGGHAVGKISGAVGTFGHIGPEVEERICARLGLRPAAIASQVISRDRHAHYIATLALVAATLEKIALEVRHLQRTEVREVEEPFAPGQKGSSAMPHKRNPVTCEQICGLARVVRGNIQAAFEDIPLWHERDISHSSVERIILPDATTAVDYMLARTNWLISGLRVSADRMKRNLDLTRGLVFSGQLLLDLSAAGMLREEAYKLVQGYAMSAWEGDGDFRSMIESDPTIAKHLSPAALENTFSVSRQLQNIDQIFQRVFPN